MTSNKPKVLDLFCGCGGLSLGFEQTGKYDIVAGIDNYEDALNTFELNHHGAKGLNIDLFDENFIDEVKKNIGTDIDVVVGGPPCQGFSVTGPRNFDDKRNTLYLAMVKTVEAFRPKAFLVENVPGLVNMYKGQVKDKIIERFTELGYNVQYKILTAADYGVPQTRRRVFFIGIRKDIDRAFNYPEPILDEKNYVSTSDAISDLPECIDIDKLGTEVADYDKKPSTEYQKKMRKHSSKLFNHVASAHSKKVTNVISLVPDGGNYKDLPEGVGTNRKFHVAWTRYNSKKPSSTIDTGHRNHFHYKLNRVPTVRENARLQSFPDNFRVTGSKTSQFRQVGNAVPPLLAQAVAEKIYEAISDD